MLINKRDQERLDAFFERFFVFLESKNTNTTYTKKTKLNPEKLIERLDGIVLPADIEAPFVLDNEFRPFIIENLLKFMRIMHQNVSSQIFGFAERPLYEYLTTWAFLFISDDIDPKHTNRLKALIFSGHFKFITEDNNSLSTYLKSRSQYLKDKDVESLNSDDVGDIKFFDYQWKVAVSIRNHYRADRYESFLQTQSGFRRINSHQSMKVHANPLSINEAVNNFEIASRHQLLLAFYARQAMDYFKSSDPQEYEKIVYLYDKFFKNNRIKLNE